MARAPRTPTTSERVLARIRATLDRSLQNADEAALSASADRAVLPAEKATLLDAVLTDSRASYRDGLIVQLGFGLEGGLAAGGYTRRPDGARGVAKGIGILLAERHIAGVRDAYQNIGKNTDQLARGNVPAFDQALRWLDEATDPERAAAFRYVLAQVSLTARNVLPEPDLDRSALTFHRCVVFLHALLAVPSGGAYQQYAVAACLEAVIEEAGQGGVGGLRVETKRLNATDAASRVAGDVQILRGNRVEEAFEVTANDWRTKVAAAVVSLRQADLQRIHIVASVEASFPDHSDALARAGEDVTVIDVAAFLRTLVATMRKPARAAALIRLYQLLDRFQPDIARTNTYVRLLRAHGLTAAP